MKVNKLTRKKKHVVVSDEVHAALRLRVMTRATTMLREVDAIFRKALKLEAAR